MQESRHQLAPHTEMWSEDDPEVSAAVFNNDPDAWIQICRTRKAQIMRTNPPLDVDEAIKFMKTAEWLREQDCLGDTSSAVDLLLKGAEVILFPEDGFRLED